MIIQPAFEVPPDIYKSLLTGDLVRYGGVVRDTSGRLVTHLKEIPAPERAAENETRIAAAGLKNHWAAAGLATVVAIAAGGGVVLAVRKRKKDAEVNVPKCVQDYEVSLESYLEAIQAGCLDRSNIDRLITDLDAVVAYGQDNDTTVAFSTDQLAKITKVACEYTIELARANPVELNETQKLSEADDGDVVVDLRQHLETQRRIFDQSA